LVLKLRSFGNFGISNFFSNAVSAARISQSAFVDLRSRTTSQLQLPNLLKFDCSYLQGHTLFEFYAEHLLQTWVISYLEQYELAHESIAVLPSRVYHFIKSYWSS
jgi:hypothetical protein